MHATVVGGAPATSRASAESLIGGSSRRSQDAGSLLATVAPGVPWVPRFRGIVHPGHSDVQG